MTNVEALKALYTALGGDAADVADATTITAVLNIIAAKYEGADDATTNAEAIANIADVAGSITPEPDKTDVIKLIERNFTTFDIPEGITTIGTSAFNGAVNLTSIDIPEGVTSIYNSAFYDCLALANVGLPNGITSIGILAFGFCKLLEAIEIPNSVESIGEQCFQGCTALKTITINKAEGSITGAPWGAPSTTQVVWRD